MKPSSNPSPSDWTPDSPEFTAFALKDGPFDPSVPGRAERRAEAEQVIAKSAALRSEIGEIRRVADDVETDLAHEPIHRLSTERRESVLAYARNPGRGLPRRSTEDIPAAGRGGWHRFWSAVTRPAMGFSLAAATALSIALALWNPWSSRPASGPSDPSGTAPAARARAAAKVAPSDPSADPSAALSAGDALPPESRTEPPVTVVASVSPKVDGGSGDTLAGIPIRGSVPRVDRAAGSGVRPGVPPSAASAASPRPPQDGPSGEVVRGEPQLRWERPGQEPAAAPAAPRKTATATAAGSGREAGPPASQTADRPMAQSFPGRRPADPSAAGSSASAVPARPGSAAGVPVGVGGGVGTGVPIGPASATARTAVAGDPAPIRESSPVPSRREVARTTREFPFQSAATQPRSTFPLKPGDDSYPEVRQALEAGRLPAPDSVRLEELLNHFAYDHPVASGAEALSARVEVADSPWNPDHRLVKIGLQARPSDPAVRPPANLVVLVGLRPGSEARLAWAQRSLQAVVDALDARDSLALLVDGPRGRVILPPTSGRERDRLVRGVSGLLPEGAPQGLDGLRRAYALASQRHVTGGTSRVVWILDGEFSAEAGTRGALADLIREQTEWGVFLTVLGLGPGTSAPPAGRPWMPTPAGGSYAAAAGPAEARAALRRELHPAASPVADDVTVDVRFNPDRVDRWRLIGQEATGPGPQRGAPADRAGVRLDPGDSVTALYEIVPARPERPGGPGASAASTAGSGPGGADPGSKGLEAHAGAGELLSLQVGFRPPAGDPAGAPRPGDPKASGDPAARSLRVDVPDASRPVDAATADYKFAAAVVGYGLLLRDSPYKGDLTWDKVLALAEEGQGPDREGYRMEFLQLVRRAQALHGAAPSVPGAPVRPRP